MKTSTLQVVLPDAPAAIYKLCKHFAKKIPVSWTDDHTRGQAQFDWGQAMFSANNEVLHIECRAGDPASMARLTDVVAQHVALLLRRHPQPLTWSPTAESV